MFFLLPSYIYIYILPPRTNAVLHAYVYIYAPSICLRTHIEMLAPS